MPSMKLRVVSMHETGILSTKRLEWAIDHGTRLILVMRMCVGLNEPSTRPSSYSGSQTNKPPWHSGHLTSLPDQYTFSLHTHPCCKRCLDLPQDALLQKLHLFKSPHGRKTSASQSTDDEIYPPLPILARPQSAMDSPRQQLDLDVRARAISRLAQCSTSETSYAYSNPLPALISFGSAVSYHPELPRVLFPAPPSSMRPSPKVTCPTQTRCLYHAKPRQASLLKTCTPSHVYQPCGPSAVEPSLVAKAAAAAASAKTGRDLVTRGRSFDSTSRCRTNYQEAGIPEPA